MSNVHPVIRSGAFDGGFGPLGSSAPMTDYFLVSRPRPEAVLATVTNQQQTGSSVKQRHERIFRGKLTPGERSILIHRASNTRQE